MDKKKVKFSQHALRRARERHLWKYVNREKFLFDAKHAGLNKAELEKCIYIFVYHNEDIIIKTMFQIVR